jgi:hypothetical protein
MPDALTVSRGLNRPPISQSHPHEGDNVMETVLPGNQPSRLRKLWAAVPPLRKTVEEMGRPRGPRDPNHLAKRIADIAIGEVEDVVRCVKKECRRRARPAGMVRHDATGFCPDSALEGAGFEPSVPLVRPVPEWLKKAPELCAHGQPRCARTPTRRSTE